MVETSVVAYNQSICGFTDIREIQRVCQKVSDFLNNYDIRGLVDDRNEKIGKKIRDAELAKRPFMLIVGEKEFNSEQVSVRQRGRG